MALIFFLAFDLEPLLEHLNGTDKMDTEERKKRTKEEAGLLSNHLDFVRTNSWFNMPATTIFFLSKKWIYVVCNIIQLYALFYVVGEGNWFWVLDVSFD